MTEILQDTWSQRNKDVVINLLDQVICKTGEIYFRELQEEMEFDKAAISNQIDSALEQLLGINYAVPKYSNKWVALLYFLWYQPRQISLAYHSIYWLLKHKLTKLDKHLYIFDYACGSLAMQFGITLAVADILECGHNIEDVIIEGVDKSKSMIDLGEKSWAVFKEVLTDQESYQLLNEAARIIDPIYSCIITEKFTPLTDRDYIHWFSMFHGVYYPTIKEMDLRIQNWFDHLKPEVVILTSSKSKTELVDSVTPKVFPGDNSYTTYYYSIGKDESDNFWRAILAQITSYRQTQLSIYSNNYSRFFETNVSINPAKQDGTYIKYIIKGVS